LFESLIKEDRSETSKQVRAVATKMVNRDIEDNLELASGKEETYDHYITKGSGVLRVYAKNGSDSAVL
jgi:hypothetical protein